MSNKPMRAVMPEVAAFVDAFRDAGLTDDEAIKRGRREGGFHARENGHSIGKPIEWESGVQPVLPLEAESRLADLWWKRGNA